MTKQKRIIGVLYGIVLSLTLGACSKGETENTEGSADIKNRYELDAKKPAWQLDKKEELTELTWYVNADWWNTDWGNDVVTKQMEKDLNVKIKFIKGDDTNLNTMFAGDDMADIVTLFDSHGKVAKQASNWAYSLDELAETYDPYWQEVAAEDTLKWFKLADGKTYGYPNYSNTAQDYEDNLIPSNTAYLIRKDVYESIGSPEIGTRDEFRQGMKAIKAKFPELVPFGFRPFEQGGTGSLGDALQDFIGLPIETTTGDMYDRNMDKEYLGWLETFREVHSDGNISDDSFADDATAFEEKVKSGKYATIMASGTAQMGGMLQSWLADHPGQEYIAIDGPQSATGLEPKLNQTGISGWMVNYISKTSADPAKAMQIFTYLQSEAGGILTNYGIENQTFTYAKDGKIILKPEIVELKDNEPEKFEKDYRLSEVLFFGHDKYLTYASVDTQPVALKQPKEWGAGKLFPHFILENIDPDVGSPEARSLSNIKTNWSKTLVGLIRAESQADFDKLLSEHEAFLKDNNWQKIEDIYNQKIKENKKKLGLD